MNANREHLRTFEDLEAWQACRVLRRWVYAEARRFPSEERFRLADQVIRSSRSSTDLIAEGYGLFHYKETIHYMRRSRGSVYETLNHFITGNDDGFIEDDAVERCRELVQTATKLINGYIAYLKRQQAAAKPRRKKRKCVDEGEA